MSVAYEIIPDEAAAKPTRRGAYEPMTSALFRERCKRAAVADIGAFAGHFTRLALDAGARHVFAFEPRHDRYLYLTDAFRKECPCHDLTLGHEPRAFGQRLIILRYSVADELGGGELHYTPGRPMTASLRKSEAHTQVQPTVTIPLDLFVADWDVIKIDVEGAEPLVIRGAREQIRRNKPTIFVEVLSDEIGRAIERELPIPYRFSRISEEHNKVRNVDSLRVGPSWGNFMLEPK